MRGTAQLNGTLAIADTPSSLVGDTLTPGESARWTLVLAEHVESKFLNVDINGTTWAEGHQRAGMFEHLEYGSDQVSLVRYQALPGDANGDRAFNSSDMLFIFQAGQYEDLIEDNSDWTTGDWTGDDDFTSHDLIVALQAGGYELASEAALPVPEPTTQTLWWMLGAFGVPSWGVGRHRARSIRCGKPTRR